MAVDNVVGIGSGTMEGDVAQVCAQAGIRVELKDAALELFDGTRATQKNAIADDLNEKGCMVIRALAVNPNRDPIAEEFGEVS